MKKNDGITLIALVVTIVILLMLAGVSISMLGGENGIISRATESKLNTEIANEKEFINIATSAIKSTKISIGDTSEISVDELQNELNHVAGEGKVSVSLKSGLLNVYYEESKRDYDVNPDGTFALDWDKILENATAHPDQDIANPDIGIGPSGEPVNLDYWYYYINGDGIYIGSYYYNYGYSSSLKPGYIGPIENNTIKGEFPQYIKISSTWYPVTSLNLLFSSSSAIEIQYIPSIPSTVISLYGTFYKCQNLKSISLPSTLKYLGRHI